jgi:acetolactate synthase-1/2/3 large subunit
MAACRLSSLRQLGDQEADIIPMVQGITKYSVMVEDPATIRYHLEKALHLAVSGRLAPAGWIFPGRAGSPIEPETLVGYTPEEEAHDEDALCAQCDETLERLAKAKRPVLLVGTGIHLAGAEADFDR